LTILKLLTQTFITNIHNNVFFYNDFSNPITVIGSEELL